MVDTNKEVAEIISIREQMGKLLESANLKTMHDEFRFREKDVFYLRLFDRLCEIEDIISIKVKPFINEAIEKKDFHSAKLIASKAYQGQESAGLILLFRSIIFMQKKAGF